MTSMYFANYLQTIFGIRHRCLECPDCDYCSACVSNASRDHPDHHFERLADPRERTAATVANQSLLQAKIKQDMAALKNSKHWKDLDRASEEQRTAAKDRPESVKIILDWPDDNHDEEQFALFLIMSSRTRRFHEGLVLTRAGQGARYRRVGFFSTKLAPAFDDANMSKVELI